MTRDEVLDAALEIIDEEGLEALSMRHLAKRLDTGSMRAYRHFSSKEDLLEALADREARRVRSIDLSGISEPRELLLEAACRTRDLLLEHPNLAPVVVSRPLSKATAADDLRLAGALLRSEGFADYQVGPVSAGLAAYTLGFVLYELGQRRFHQDSRDEMLAFYDELAAGVSGDDLLAAQVAGIRGAVDDDWGSLQFRTGLKAMIDGFWSQRALVDTRRS
ncbi:MAG: TetR/AcrR family transcriptional regulator [Actinomycetes bacterium]